MCGSDIRCLFVDFCVVGRDMLGFAIATSIGGSAFASRSSCLWSALRHGNRTTERALPRHRRVLYHATTRAVGSDASPSDDLVVTSIQKKLQSALSPQRLDVRPTYGDLNGAHISIDVVSDAFEGLSMVKRQQLVYKAIWDELQGPVHAVDRLTTSTPRESGS